MWAKHVIEKGFVGTSVWGYEYCFSQELLVAWTRFSQLFSIWHSGPVACLAHQEKVVRFQQAKAVPW